MGNSLNSPTNFKIVAGNKSSTASWDPVDGADGYRIDYYLSSEPSKRIKYRYAQGTKKRILGFKNGTEYFACVSAFKYDGNTEVFGVKSDNVYFTPISMSLSAQNIMCLSEGETQKIQWDYRNTKPEISVNIQNENIARLEDDFTIRGIHSGETCAFLSLVDKTEKTQSFEDSFCMRISVGRNLYNEHASDQNINIMLTGDLMCSLGAQVAARNRSYDFSNLFSKRLISTLNSADLVIGNLETMCDDGSPFENEIYRLPRGSANNNSPSTFLTSLKFAGFNGLVTANNHNADCGLKGLQNTVDEIRQNDMENIGSLSDNPVIFNIKGQKIAIIALSMVNNGIDDLFENPIDELARYSEAQFLKLVKAAREAESDYIVVMMHWGRMNSTSITTTQSNTAHFLAENGADIIVGSEPHVLQRYELITNSFGQKIPCFYSLGNFYSSMREMYENTVAGIVNINIPISSSKDTVCPKLSFIPTLCLNNGNSAIADLIEPMISDKHLKAMEYIDSLFDQELIFSNAQKKLIAFQGSSILRDIRKEFPHQTFDKGLIISPFSIFDSPIPSNNQYSGISNNLGIDLSKTYKKLLEESNSDFFCFDLYAAAAISIYKYESEGVVSHFTGTNRFLKSDFYRQNSDKLTRILPDEEIPYKISLFDNYLDTISSLFSHDRIILIRIKLPAMGSKRGELRNTSQNGRINKTLKLLEEYAISKINPCLIDISKYYFKNVENLSTFKHEDLFYKHCAKCISEYIENPSGKFCFDSIDYEIWMQRILAHYKNMTARSYQKYLLNDFDAADIIISNSSYSFVCKYQTAIIQLKKAGASLQYVHNVLEGIYSEVEQAASAIENMNKGDINKPYSDYEVAFKYNFNILKSFARVLSKHIGYYVSQENVGEVYLIKDDKEALAQYFSSHPVTNIDIWGSCISREIANRASARINVVNYIFKQTQLLSSKAPISCPCLSDNVVDYGNNAWRMRTIQGAFLRNGRSILEKGNSDYLVIDFYDIICTMKKYQNELFEIDDFIERTNFYKEISSECETTYLYKEMNKRTALTNLKEFADFVKGIYGNNIILIIADLKKDYLDMDGNLQALHDDGSYNDKVEFIQYIEKAFIKATNCYVIDDSVNYCASDLFPLGGAHIVHYESDFYEEACKKLISITSSP